MFFLGFRFFLFPVPRLAGVFLWGKEHGNSIFDRLYRMICMYLPALLKKVGVAKDFGARHPSRMVRVMSLRSCSVVTVN